MAASNGVTRFPTLGSAILGVALVWAVIYFAAVRPHSQTGTEHPDSIWGNAAHHSPAPSALDIETAFAGVEYSLEAVADGTFDVPQVRLSGMPADMRGITDTDGRKSLFLRMVLPLVLSANEAILEDRARIEAIRRQAASNHPVSRTEGEWLGKIARAYKISPSAGLAGLLRRVDVVPPSLALAQAAEESGWGTSRFARQGNALFGQWGASDPRRGQTAAARGIESDYNVKTFATPADAVRAYIHNLNTHRAYVGFRELRAWQRRRGMEPDGASLVHSLENYSELATDYVKSLRVIMRSNRLGALDDARLSEDPVTLTF